MYKVMHSTVFFRVGSGGAEASMETNACACSGFLLLARNTSAHCGGASSAEAETDLDSSMSVSWVFAAFRASRI